MLWFKKGTDFIITAEKMNRLYIKVTNLFCNFASSIFFLTKAVKKLLFLCDEPHRLLFSQSIPIMTQPRVGNALYPTQTGRSHDIGIY